MSVSSIPTNRVLPPGARRSSKSPTGTLSAKAPGKKRILLTTWGSLGDLHPFIALALLVADYLYFSALRHPDALVAIVMSLRRASTLVAFAGGLYFFREANGWKKFPAVLGILLGVVLTLLG